YWPSFVRDEQQLLEPDARADRSVEEQGYVQAGCLCPSEEARRRSRPFAPREDRREADDAHGKAGRVSRRVGRRPVQAESLPVLVTTVPKTSLPVLAGRLVCLRPHGEAI